MLNRRSSSSSSRTGSGTVAVPSSATTTEEVIPLTASTFQSGTVVESWPPLEGGGTFLAGGTTAAASAAPPIEPNNGEDPRNLDDDGGDDSGSGGDHGHQQRTKLQKAVHAVWEFYEKFDFPIHVLLVILLAYLYPPLGAVYVAPAVTANYVAVCYIFTLFGLGVKTDEFTSALTKMPFNALIQVYNLGYISAVVFGVTRLLALAGILTQTLADGLAIASCLPMSINVGIILTMAAGGDEAVAIFNTSFGNFVGVFLSPALILGYLGTIGFVDVGQVYTKLSLIVIVPLVAGQLVQRLVPTVRDFYFAHKKVFKKTAEWALVFIIYTIFSRNFYSGTKVPIGQVFVLIACIICFIVGFMATTWQMLRVLYKNNPILRITGTFISIQKTIALGVPLITSIYGGNPNLAFYTLPILCWHPLQLILGSMIVPSMIRFLAREKERLAALNNDEMATSDEETAIEVPGVTPRPASGINEEEEDGDDAGDGRGAAAPADGAEAEPATTNEIQ